VCVALEAARDGLLDVVKAHIDTAQSHINDVDDEGYTAMHYAARYNRVAVMDALFAAGAGTIIHAYIYHSTISLSLSLSLSVSLIQPGMHGTDVRRYNWHSAGSLGWPFPALK